MTDILNRRLIRSDDAVESAVGDETVILHLVNGTYYGLDPVGTRIWGMIKDRVGTPDICRRLAEEYEVDLATIEADARKFLTDLEAQGILVDG
ncbi:MAG: PqqD family protein [Pseudomonadota bacterium]